MEFWGVEVKAGKPLKVVPENGKLIHISQAALGEGKRDKATDIVPIHLNIDDKKIVLGSLSADNFPQIAFDLVFEKEFELSHDWKNGSVYFCGYIAANPYEEEDDDEFDSDSEDEENILLPTTQNGKVEPQAGEVKPAATKGKAKAARPESSAKSKVTVVKPKKDKSDSDDDDVSDDEEMVDAGAEVKEMKKIYGGSSDSDDSEDDFDDLSDSDEETPDKPADKKRPNESVSKTPVAKKSKIVSAKKTDGKKGGHVATPHPSKKTEKSPAPIKQSPKSDAKISCNSCPKKFTSDGALQSHTKAKHAAK